MRNWILAFLLLGFVLAVSSSRVMAGDDVEETKAMIETINDKVAKAVVSGDTVTAFAYYTDDVVSMPNYEKVIQGLDALKKQSRDAERAGTKITSMSLTTSEVLIYSDCIVEIGQYGVSLILPGMEKPVADNGKYVNVWVKQPDGSLKIRVEIWNTDVNPWIK